MTFRLLGKSNITTIDSYRKTNLTERVTEYTVQNREEIYKDRAKKYENVCD